MKQKNSGQSIFLFNQFSIVVFGAAICATVAIVILASPSFSPSPSILAAVTQKTFPFEDVNNNGIWDEGVDRDITSELLPNDWYIYFKTPNSIVIPAGIKFLRSKGDFTGYTLEAGKNLTINSSINSVVYGGTVDLRADGNITIGPKVTLNGRDYVTVYADGNINLGDGSSLASRGGSANFGSITVRSEAGNISFGKKVRITPLNELFVMAMGGDISSAPGLQISSSKDRISFYGQQISIDGSLLRAEYITIDGSGKPLSVRNSRISVPRNGLLHISNIGSSIDIRGTILPKINDIRLSADTVLK